MAQKKGGGSTSNGRNSPGQRLGVKMYGGQTIERGSIIVRQRGTQYHPGKYVGVGKDYTLFALCDGVIKFHGGLKNRQYVSIVPAEENAA